MIIAIDGPAGAGKSTVAREIAKKLSWIYIDTGAMYRAVALCAINKGIDLTDINSIIKEVNDIQIDISHIDKEQHILLNKEDVTSQIRTSEISNGASQVAIIPEVREKLVDLQRQLANKDNVIMDGRDIGSVVFPNAQLKIFLTASSEERANRRYKEQLEKGKTITYNEVLNEINDRDNVDLTRAVSPLIQASDAILIDTTQNTSDMVINRILDLTKDKLGVQID
ncbi:cytidylate kinase [Candidatus Epulonipiscioides gigas]|nr:cytidylate kinase [Epulopiscium sp. SCG-C07WGA-EpuloA2]